MKKLATAIIFLSLVSTGHGDRWSDRYETQSDWIKRALELSVQHGYQTAIKLAEECYGYIDGFIDGNLINQNPYEFKSSRYSAWEKRYKILLDKKGDALDDKSYEGVFFYSNKMFELNCNYMYELKREHFGNE